MKKTIILLLSIVFVLTVFAGCNLDDSKVTTEVPTETPPKIPTAPPIEKPNSLEEEETITYFSCVRSTHFL